MDFGNMVSNLTSGADLDPAKLTSAVGADQALRRGVGEARP